MHAELTGADCALRGSFVKTMDARLKIVFGALCIVMSTASSGAEVPLFVGAVCAALLASSGVRARQVLVRAAEPLFFGLVLAAFQAFLVPGESVFGTELFGFALTATREGIARGLYILARVFGGVMVVLFVGMTSPVDRLLAAAAWLGAPRGLVEVSMFAYRYVFVLIEDAVTVYHAQRGRLGYTGVLRSVRSLGTLAGSVFLRAFDQAEATGEAMALRGYTGSYVPACRERRGAFEIAFMGGLALVTLTLFIWT